MIQLLFALSILFTGLCAGIGFANLLGYLPAFKKMEQVHALAMWQAVDHYFRARMPVFGISLQISLLLTLIKSYTNTPAFSLVAISFLLSITELFIIKKKNLPLNVQIQSMGEKPSADFEKIRSKAIKLFQWRGVIDIISFALVIIAFMTIT